MIWQGKPCSERLPDVKKGMYSGDWQEPRCEITFSKSLFNASLALIGNTVILFSLQKHAQVYRCRSLWAPFLWVVAFGILRKHFLIYSMLVSPAFLQYHIAGTSQRISGFRQRRRWWWRSHWTLKRRPLLRALRACVASSRRAKVMKTKREAHVNCCHAAGPVSDLVIRKSWICRHNFAWQLHVLVCPFYLRLYVYLHAYLF